MVILSPMTCRDLPRHMAGIIPSYRPRGPYSSEVSKEERKRRPSPDSEYRNAITASSGKLSSVHPPNGTMSPRVHHPTSRMLARLTAPFVKKRQTEPAGPTPAEGNPMKQEKGPPRRKEQWALVLADAV